MTDNEKIQSFGDMIDATERLTKPWRLALLITNLLWAICFLAFIWLAYMTPVEMEQSQNIPDGSQTQSYSEGATSGK